MALIDAIEHMQNELGVKVDGKWGPKTQAALDKALKAVPELTPPKTGELNARSLKNLASCHGDLQKLAAEMRKRFDFTVICGHRGEKDQNKAFAEGKSKLKWPKSKHNKTPSLAFDACPNPIDWDNTKAFDKMREVAKECAADLGIKIRLISWDKPHIELA